MRRSVETNKHGQAIGRKGADTRQRILDAARQLLEAKIGSKLTVTAVARAAGISSPTFYLYFKDTGDVLLELSREACIDTDEVLRILHEPWPLATLRQESRRFVDAFYRYWDRHREVLGIRNFQSDLGDEAFNQVRRDAAMPIVMAIAERILAANVHSGLDEADAKARAIIIYAAIERLASRYSPNELQPDDLNSEDLLRAEADILALLFTPTSHTSIEAVAMAVTR